MSSSCSFSGRLLWGLLGIPGGFLVRKRKIKTLAPREHAFTQHAREPEEVPRNISWNV